MFNFINNVMGIYSLILFLFFDHLAYSIMISFCIVLTGPWTTNHPLKYVLWTLPEQSIEYVLVLLHSLVMYLATSFLAALLSLLLFHTHQYTGLEHGKIQCSLIFLVLMLDFPSFPIHFFQNPWRRNSYKILFIQETTAITVIFW